MLSPTVKGKVYQIEVVAPDASTEGNVSQVEIVGGGQVQSMFEPQESLLGLIVQYVGETTADYTNGYFYQVIESEDEPGTYVWVNKSVQSGGGSSGAVDSVNGKTGVVVLDAEDVGATTKNIITLTGESGTLTAEQIAQVLDNTAVLEIVCDGEVFRLSNKDSTLTYRTFINTNCEASDTVSFKVIYVQLNSEAINYGAWTLEEVSAGGLPDQTGNAGKFLTTDGTGANWSTTVSDTFYVKNLTSNQTIDLKAGDGRQYIYFHPIKNNFNRSAVISVDYGVSNGEFNFRFERSFVIGHYDKVTIGATNNIIDLMYVAGFASSSRRNIITVPDVAGTMVVATPPSANGTYVLKATVTDGVVTYAWVAE